MTTIQDCNKYIAELVQQCEIIKNSKLLFPDKKEKLINKACNKIAFYRMIIKYLEYKPTADFILHEFNRIKNIVDKIKKESNSEIYKTKVSKDLFLKESEYKKFQLQFKTLTFLID